jgi:hypothetical protein
LAAFAIGKTGVAFLSPQLLDLLRWGRSLSTAKAARQLGFRAARDTQAAFDDFIQQRRVHRYAADHHAYQYEKELEDFIHTRQLALEDGEGDSNGAAPPDGSAKPLPSPRRSRSLRR